MPTLKRDREAMDDEGARKKMKTSPVDDTPTIHPIMDLTADEPQSNPGAQVPASPELQTLKTLQGDFDDLRNLVTCRICERLLYEPYTISCGHTYCYSCLCTWFGTSKKKTCPGCRVVITQPPAPSYVIREMINIFMRSHNLLPDGEAIEQHQQWAFEEAELVKNDKNNEDPKTGGLFKGMFRQRRKRLLPNHDPVDHVDRCPRCNWEIEDGMCMQCGIQMDSWSDESDISTSDLSNSLHAESIEDDFEEDDMDADPDFGEFDGEFDIDINPQAYDAFVEEHGGALDYLNQGAADRAEFLREMVARQRARDRQRGREAVARMRAERDAYRRATRDPGLLDEDAEDDLMDHDEDEDEDDDEDAGSIDEFLDDRDVNDITNYDISSQTEDPTPARRQRHRHHQSEASSSESDSTDSDSDGVRHNPRFRRPPIPVYTIDSEDDEEPVAASTRRRPIRVVDSDDDSNPQTNSSEDDEDDEAPRAPPSRPGVFAPRRFNPPVLARRQRPIRVLDSEDEDEEVSNSSGTEEEEQSLDTAADADAEVQYNDYSDDIEAAQGGAEQAGFSPMQDSGSEDEDEGDQNAVNYFNVYGEEDGEEDAEEDGYGDEEEDDYY